ncbi:BRCA1-associated protein-like [Mercenaria mercenaria]|uniref:BRCA1-associated protein-like n=1 Tax=Mercenaria mercenaria TaxID=6596 RepID=UPI00234F1752|nr:BRCA1-associated protein-like [Mercenaria mercenaria]
MTVALLNIRFEICEPCETVPNIEFSAKGLIVPADKSAGRASYASVVQEDTPPPTPDEERELGLNDYRGCRKPHDIQIETYNCKDFDLSGIEAFLEGSPISMTSNFESEVDVGELKSGTRESSIKENDTHKLDDIDQEHKELTQNAVADFENVCDKQMYDSGVRPKSQSPTPKGLSAIHFYSGNPTVEKVKGILHIYKDNHLTSLSDETQRSELICMLAVPAKYTIHDLLKFNGPCLAGIEYMRIIRDGSPNQYMVLVKFRNQKFADEYYTAYNNTTFNSIETDICHLVYVGRVEMLKESENACMPVPGMTELPNCPVCLERMDESVDGILTILCNHAFHMECLDKWGDTSCPVCRYCQTPEEAADNRCMKCGSQESLWICLICGNIGCGRYVGLHAFRHFQETHHTYAMELGNNKVWDYIGDNYVHRLVQNKSDGKLVRVDEGGNPVQDEKMDALNLEYTYLLTNQLESQRLYFEEKIEEVEKTVLGKVHLVEEENLNLAEQCSHLHVTLEAANKEKQLCEKKCSHLQTRLKKALHDLQEEKEMNKCLLENQLVWQKRVTSLENEMKDFTAAKDKELQDLREQLRDVMFYVEAQGKLQHAEGVSQEEIEGSHVIVGAASGTSTHSRKARKKQR